MRQRKLFVLVAALSVCQIGALGSVALAQDVPEKGKPPKVLRKLLGPEDRKKGIHDGNKILTLFYNDGGIGGGELVRIESGVYPKGSGHSYIYEFTPVVGCEIRDAKRHVRHLFSDGMVSSRGADINPRTNLRWGFWPLPGYANPDQDYVAMSDKPETWPLHWPDRDASWDGFWNGQYGKYARADQESYYRMNDYENDEFEFYPDPDDSTKRGLAVEVEVRGYQWAHPAAEDILIWTYWITNTGKTNYEKMVFGMYGDADVGDSGDAKDDDAWFDVQNDIVYQWDHDHKGAWGGPPAYFGYKFLESPGNPYDGIDNDGDGMVDERQDDGIDNDGDWNVELDDVGSDGLGPQHPLYPGPDADGTEGNGQPDPGEPNFEFTDNDEADQIGLTSFAAAPWPTISPQNDEDLWARTVPGNFDEIQQTVDLTFLYGSGYFPLPPGEKRKFAIALLFGEDYDDILRNAVTMQRIYDADYSFAQPPQKPRVWAVAGDHRVTLYWDKTAEETTRDPIYGYDFEGYRIYRATDPAFLESWIITDAYGNKTFNKPVAQFDRIDGLKGPHPIAFNGIQYNMGTDSGLRYTWTDTAVENGQTYYYAVVSYDQGYDYDFPERGINPLTGLMPIAPAECTKRIVTDATGRVLETDVNTVVVTPNAPAAGYVPPPERSTEDESIEHVSGTGTGDILVDALDPLRVVDGARYRITFDDTSDYATEHGKTFSVLRLTENLDTLWVDTTWQLLEVKHLDSASVQLVGLNGVRYEAERDFAVNADKGLLRALPEGRLAGGAQCVLSYRYYPVYRSGYLHGEDFNPYFDGLRIRVWDDPLAPDSALSRWYREEDLRDALERYGFIGAGDPLPAEHKEVCNYRGVVQLYPNQGVAVPYDYEIVVYDRVMWRSVNGKKPAKFLVFNATTGDTVDFVFMDVNRDSALGDQDVVIPVVKVRGRPRGTWQVKFWAPEDSVVYRDSLVVKEGGVVDTLKVPVDTLRVAVAPKPGDVFRIEIRKPFTQADVFEMEAEGPRVELPSDRAKVDSALARIAVVPNPYVVTASWEPQHFYKFGRGRRKLDFIHLPAKCVIKIFTVRGYLVDELVHDSPI
ncbi:MAG: hypothetical protein GXO73_09135, partial [Calditrichaeota bacterium]|nr:hypothetical protein [Calditrichota bacterium]